MKNTIEQMQKIAEERGGKCLSTIYENAHKKLDWECSKGHQWSATAHGVKNHSNWCPICNGKQKLNIEEMVRIAKERGGYCLSKKYVNTRTKLEWECKNGHKWWSTPKSIRRGHWCSECYGNTPLDLKQMQELAKKRGGKCLSQEYVNSSTKMEWECADGHRWWQTPNAIKSSNYWCPYCNFYVVEECLRYAFEHLTGKPFPKKRPKWLTTSLGARLELDGYCEELKCAFEFHGEQHFKKSQFFQKSEDAFKKQQMNDLEKANLCLENDTILFTFDYSEDLFDMKSLIKKRVDKNITLKPFFEFSKEIDFDKVRNNLSQIRKLRDVASSNGGKCNSKIFLGMDKHYSFECTEGHIWEARASDVIHQNTWCKICAGNEKQTIEVAKKFAEKRGGYCLSEKYINNKAKLNWQCSKGHEWQQSFHEVKNGGSWCPVCAGNLPLSLDDVKKLATKKGGRCISEEYRNIDSKLMWICAKGHKWEASAHSVKGGSWCPMCAGNRKLDIGRMRQIAKSKGGKCLSQKYRNNKTPLEWECDKGHRWFARPDMVKNQNSWCPKCKVIS